VNAYFLKIYQFHQPKPPIPPATLYNPGQLRWTPLPNFPPLKWLLSEIFTWRVQIYSYPICHNSFNALSDLSLDFNDFSDTGLTEEEIKSENIDFDTVNIDASVVKAKLGTHCSTRGKATYSAPEVKGLESVARLLKSVI
jgi:hypothetical protein